TGGLSTPAWPPPGHKDAPLGFVGNEELCCPGDVLFKAAGGGGDFEQIRRSVMDMLMKLPPETRVLPGHTDETTIGREWEQNPFVRYWRGVVPEGDEPGRVAREEGTIVVDSPDYDGNGQLPVRFEDGPRASLRGS